MNTVRSSIPKIEGEGIVLGKPAYTDDLAPHNSLIVKVMRSPHAFAKIKNINTKEAQELQGVECILTYKNVPRNVFTRAGQGYPEPSPHDKFILDKYVRYIGDEVAVIAAKTEKIALEAMKLIKVDYEVFNPVVDFEKAEGHSSIIHPEEESHEMFPTGYNPSKNIASEYHMHFGDVDKVLENCKYIAKERYYTQAQAHAAMETHSSFAYIDLQGRINLVTSTQTPFHIRRIIAKAINVPLDKIRVFKPRIGGGFGGKQQVHGEVFVALVSLRTGKPAKLIYTREEVFEASFNRHSVRIDVTVGADENGYIKVIDMDVLSNTGAYGEHALTVLMGVGSKSMPLYNKAEAGRFGGKAVYTNLTPTGAYRGYGAVQGNFALESTVDILAQKIGIDPINYRKMNMIKEGQTSPIFKIMGEGKEGTDMNVESCKLDYCIKRACEITKWKEKYPRIKLSKNKLRGIGCAIAMHGSGIAGLDLGSAIIKLNDSGFFNLLLGATDIGTGSDTILAQIVAEELNVPVERIIVFSSDTDVTPFDCGAYASSTTYVTGNAVKIAAQNMKKVIEKAGAERFGVSQDFVEFDGEFIKTKDGKNIISLSDFSTEIFYSNNHNQLVASGSFCGEVSPPPYLAAIAEVEVDIETGKLDLIEYSSIIDCGTTINPNLCKVQAEGGLLQGIGMTLFEKAEYTEKGKLINNNFINYKIPSRKDFGKITVEFADSYEPTGPYGAKSIGEIVIDSPPAAIANAIYNAIGVRITKLPITPEDILMALRKKNNN